MKGQCNNIFIILGKIHTPFFPEPVLYWFKSKKKNILKIKQHDMKYYKYVN